MIVGPAVIRQDGTTAKYVVSINEAGSLPRELWFSVDARYAPLLTDRLDPALVGLLLPAMLIGKPIRTTGLVGSELLWRLERQYQPYVRNVITELNYVPIVAANQEESARRAAGVVAGFSGGVDSFSLLADHYYDPHVPTAAKVSHLFFSNVGSHGKGGRRLFLEKYKELAETGARVGLPLIAVDSNLQDFYADPRLHYMRTHTIRNAAVAHLLRAGVGTYLYASGYPYGSVNVGASEAMAMTDPVSLPILSTSELSLESVGGAYTRTEKTRQISSLAETYVSLNVCTRNVSGGNCSTCWKCVRTLSAFEMLGVLERYANVFDLTAYMRVRGVALSPILYGRDVYARELRQLARESHFKFPATACVTGPFVTFQRSIKRALGRLLRTPQLAKLRQRLR